MCCPLLRLWLGFRWWSSVKFILQKRQDEAWQQMMEADFVPIADRMLDFFPNFHWIQWILFIEEPQPSLGNRYRSHSKSFTPRPLTFKCLKPKWLELGQIYKVQCTISSAIQAFHRISRIHSICITSLASALSHQKTDISHAATKLLVSPLLMGDAHESAQESTLCSLLASKHCWQECCCINFCQWSCPHHLNWKRLKTLTWQSNLRPVRYNCMAPHSVWPPKGCRGVATRWQCAAWRFAPCQPSHSPTASGKLLAWSLSATQNT